MSFSYCCCLVVVEGVAAPSSFSAQLNVPLPSSSSAALASACFCCCVVLLHLAVCPSASHHLLPSLENSSCPCSVLPYALLLLPLLSLLSVTPGEVWANSKRSSSIVTFLTWTPSLSREFLLQVRSVACIALHPWEILVPWLVSLDSVVFVLSELVFCVS